MTVAAKSGARKSRGVRKRRDPVGSRVNLGWIALGLMALVACFLGGSSRPDVTQIIVLRPMAGLLLFFAAALLTKEKLLPGRSILIGLLVLAGIMAVQLVPLPPAIWQALPMRAPIAELGVHLGVEGLWRPISLVPDRTLNALASLVVPMAALLVALVSGFRANSLIALVAGIGVLDALIGVLQIAGVGGHTLYFYRVTNFGAPTGLFANENHSAVFSAIVLICLAYLATESANRWKQPTVRLGVAAGYMLVLVAGLLSGSRAGLATVLLAVCGSAFFVILGWGGKASANKIRRREIRKGRPGAASISSAQEGSGIDILLSPRTIAALGGGVIGLLVLTFLLLGPSSALADLVNETGIENMRAQLLPVLGRMVSDFWLAGIGFGSFEEVYHIYEPDQLLLETYVNQAHNDWAQLIIEGGILAGLLFFALVIWFARGLSAMARSTPFGTRILIFWSLIAIILMAASLVDYPLRTPLFQALAIWLMLAFSLKHRSILLKCEG